MPEDPQASPPELLASVSSLEALLSLGEGGYIGAQRLTVDLEERRFEVFLGRGSVLAVVEASSPLDLQATLDSFRIPLKGPSAQVIAMDGSYAYGEIQRGLTPDKLEDLKTIYRGVSLKSACNLERYLRQAPKSSVLRDTLPEQLASMVLRWNFLEASPQALLKEVAQELQQEAALAKTLGLMGPWRATRVENFGGQPPQEALSTPPRAAVILGARRGVTLDVLCQEYPQFSVQALLRALGELLDEKVLILKKGRLSWEVQAPRTPPSTVFLLDEDDDEVDESILASFEDDEIFPPEVSSVTFAPTPHLALPLEGPLRTVIEREVSRPETKVKLLEILLQHTELEAQVREAEAELRALAREHSLLRREEALLRETSAEGDKAAEQRLRESEILASKIFRDVERLEERRQEGNEAHRDVLEQLQVVVPLRDDDPLTQEVHATLEKKLQGLTLAASSQEASPAPGFLEDPQYPWDKPLLKEQLHE